MERGQNYGITVLHPKESATYVGPKEDIVFEWVQIDDPIFTCMTDRMVQPSCHPRSGRRPFFHMDTRQGSTYVATRSFTQGHAGCQSHDLRLQC